MQRVQNNEVRIVLELHRNVSVRSSVKHLHWLTVCERVTYKIAVLTYKAISVNKLSYLADSFAYTES